MTKPEFYLAPDGSLQPLPESGPLTLTDGALTYPGRKDPTPAVETVADDETVTKLLAATDALLARINAVSATDVSTWPQMQVGEKVTAPVERSRSIMPRVGHANARHAPMRWRGYTEGGSFVVERVA